MDGNERLRNIACRQATKKPDRTVKLGDCLTQLIDGCITPRQAKFGSIAELWEQLLPPEIANHCTLDGIFAGQLKVLVDSPSYMHELRLSGERLLDQLRQHCPKARIKKIKFVIG